MRAGPGIDSAARPARARIVERRYLLPFVLVTSLFLSWAFAASLNDVLIRHFRTALDLTRGQSSLIQLAFYIGYFCAALPAGLVIGKIGYKGGILIGLALYAAGAFAFYPAAAIRSYGAFLLALYIIAFGLAFLETSANPYIALLGESATGPARLNLAQSAYGLGAVAGPIVGGILIFSGVERTPQQLRAMPPAAAEAFRTVAAMTVQGHYLCIGLAVCALAVAIGFVRFPDLRGEAASSASGAASAFRVLRHRRLRWAVVADGFGLSERRVGDALRERPGIVVSTKVGRLLVPDAAVTGTDARDGFRSSMPFKCVFDYGYDAILRSYEDSLQRLGLARIDMLYIHDIGALTHGARDSFHFDALTRGGGLRALAELRSSGAIRAFGVGVNEVEACHRVMDQASLDVILLAGRYTLLEQGAHSTLLSRCQSSGTSIVIGGPYNSGILATGVKRGGVLHYDYRKAPANTVERVAAIETLCDRFGVPLAAAALQFPLAHPAVVSVIPGIDHPRRVAQTLELYRTAIPAGLWSALKSLGLIDESAPTPC